MMTQQLVLALLMGYSLGVSLVLLTVRRLLVEQRAKNAKQKAKIAEEVEARKTAFEEFTQEIDWLLKYTESEEVEKSLNKLKAILEKNA